MLVLPKSVSSCIFFWIMSLFLSALFYLLLSFLSSCRTTPCNLYFRYPLRFLLYLRVLGGWRQHPTFHIVFLLLSAVHLQFPLTSHCLSPPCFAAPVFLGAFFLLYSPTPTSYSRGLMHSASAPPLPPSTFPSLQSHLYSFLPPSSLPPSCFSPCVSCCLGHISAPKKSFSLHWAL